MPRRLSVGLSMLLVAGAAAQPAPPALEPIPEPPPPPAGAAPAEPAVRIPVQEGDKVEEMRQGGRVVMLRVTTPKGTTYYLIDTTGNGNWVRRDALDDGVSPPMWPIYTFD